MAITASVALFKGEYVASLNDGRHIERHSWLELAQALFEIGVNGSAIEYEWHNGQRMITAGQQVALKAEIRRLADSAANPRDTDHVAAA